MGAYAEHCCDLCIANGASARGVDNLAGTGEAKEIMTAWDEGCHHFLVSAHAACRDGSLVQFGGLLWRGDCGTLG